jgi:hypothetical protein
MLNTKQEIIEAFRKLIERLQEKSEKEGNAALATSTESKQKYYLGRSDGIALALGDELYSFLELLEFGRASDPDEFRNDEYETDELTVK